MIVEELQEQVDARWADLDLPSWPSPRPPMDSPREEEYSRVSAPARYRIVHERARLWADVLSELPGVVKESLPPAPLDEDGHLGHFDRGVRLRVDRQGTLPVLLLERDAALPGTADPDTGATATMAVLHIAVAEPRVTVAAQPDCGCDACDSGSADLLRAIDDTIREVVGGPFVALRGKGWEATWHPGGGSGGGTRRMPDFDTMMEVCRQLAAGEHVRLPRGTRAFVGQAWFVST